MKRFVVKKRLYLDYFIVRKGRNGVLHSTNSIQRAKQFKTEKAAQNLADKLNKEVNVYALGYEVFEVRDSRLFV